MGWAHHPRQPVALQFALGCKRCSDGGGFPKALLRSTATDSINLMGDQPITKAFF